MVNSAYRSDGESLKISKKELVLGIDHIAIAVRDLDESISWYCNNLGFDLQDRRITSANRVSMSSAVLRSGEATIVLVQGHQPECSINKFIDKFGPGVQHIAFEVASLFDALELFPEDAKPEDTNVIEGDGIRQVFLKRTKGSAVRVELIERQGGDFSDESVLELFTSFEERGLY
jgi:methylmalonyl-CoA/ethylmalonyl-CoA epimerase